MSREEAIEIIQQNMDEFKEREKENGTYGKPIVTVDPILYKAFEMAISALEQQKVSCDAVNIWYGHTTIPNETVFDFSDGTRKAVKVVEDRREQEPCEDVISREAVIEDVMKCTDMNEDTLDVLIEIPEEKYEIIKKQVVDGVTNPLKICIANGTILPKHGRLGDLDEIIKTIDREYPNCDRQDMKQWIENADTILEANE